MPPWTPFSKATRSSVTKPRWNFPLLFEAPGYLRLRTSVRDTPLT